MPEKILKFPEGFLWGAATSAHQVEGGNFNDWSEWEKKSAQAENYISGRACDHYNLYEQDFDIAKSLGHNAHRFSIEWSRVEPEQGKFNEAELGHYCRVISALRERGLEPFVTLWHFTLPLWAAEQGGWQNKKTAEDFCRYVEKVVGAFKPEVKFWIILNEPDVYPAESYLKGAWPPQKKNIFAYLKVIKNLSKAHKTAYEIIKKIEPEAQVGIAKNNIYFEPYKNKLINLCLKKLADWWCNFYFLNRIKNFQDFIGLNYYFHNLINCGFSKNENKIVSDMGWELYPQGIYYILKDLQKYQKPIYITENGLADSQDQKRAWFIKETLRSVHQAIEEGVDVRGYFHWSLLDNFEWDKGFWPRFGLVEIDYKTLERKVRPSAWEYARICKNNELNL